MNRAAAIDRFLAATGWDGARQEPLPSDASFRRYVRLSAGPRRALLMDAPPPREDVRPWLAVARHLNALGLSAPRVEAADVENGLLLIEDFGDDTYTRLFAAGRSEGPLYALAIDVLAALRRHERATALGLPPYDERRLLDEVLLLTDWYLPAIRGAATPEPVRASYLDAWKQVLPAARGVPDTLVLRDYHVDNLMLLPDRDGIAACGLIDFQDALIGPVSYDLVSLLEDARRDIDPGLVAALRARYLAAMPEIDPEALDRSCAILGAQRHAKVIGIFTRLHRRDGKPVYLKHIPRVWRLLEGSLRHPALAPVRAWADIHIPPPDRRTPDLL